MLNKVRTIKGIERIIYSSEAEFRKDHPDVSLEKNWRKAPEDAWVLTDNKKVVQVIARKDILRRNKKYEFIRTAYGQFLCEDYVRIDGEPKNNIYTFGGKSWYEYVNDRKEPTKREFMFAKYYTTESNAVEAYMKAYGTGTTKNAKEKSSLLLKQRRVIDLINTEFQKALDENEASPTYLVREMKGIIDDASSNNRDKIQSIKVLMQVSGMLSTEKKTESVTVFQGFSQEQLDAIKQQKPKAIAHAERAIEPTT